MKNSPSLFFGQDGENTQLTKTKFIEAILRDWHGETRKPKIARAVFCCRKMFPGFAGELIREIHLHGGDWRQTVQDLLAMRGGCPALPRSRVMKFAAWAEKVTARPVRGLLTWKGGVS